MPPRKRAESKPPEPVEAEPEAPSSDGVPPEGPAPTDPETAPEEKPPADPDEPEKSDLQPVEQPCPICIPNGWTEGAFSMGCEHGTWVRDNA